jgi:hypothetical protein
MNGITISVLVAASYGLSAQCDREGFVGGTVFFAVLATGIFAVSVVRYLNGR